MDRRGAGFGPGPLQCGVELTSQPEQANPRARDGQDL